jgi:hypothetical protein
VKLATGTIAVWGTILLLGVSVASAGPLEGQWRLVEQTYGSGLSNLVVNEPPLRLEFYREGGRLAARAWFGQDTERVFAWPSLLADDGPAVSLEEYVVTPQEDGVRVRYRTEPASAEETALEFVEEYNVTDDGKTLVGTVTVSRLHPGEEGGSYVLHRRFEREP